MFYSWIITVTPYFENKCKNMLKWILYYCYGTQNTDIYRGSCFSATAVMPTGDK